MLSCVKVMIAFGGKSEKGVLTDRNENRFALGTGSDVAIVCSWEWEDRRDIKVRKTVVTRKAQTMISRGGRMVKGEEGLIQLCKLCEMEGCRMQRTTA